SFVLDLRQILFCKRCRRSKCYAANKQHACTDNCRDVFQIFPAPSVILYVYIGKLLSISLQREYNMYTSQHYFKKITVLSQIMFKYYSVRQYNITKLKKRIASFHLTMRLSIKMNYFIRLTLPSKCCFQ